MDQYDGAFTDQPVPPWELPGNFRLDCEPHRAGLLAALSGVNLLIGFLSLLPPCVPACASLGTLLALLLGLTVWRLARNDLTRMRAGRVDPSGLNQTED